MPPGRNYRFRIATSDIPKRGLPAAPAEYFEVPGDSEPQPLTVAVRRDDRDRCIATVIWHNITFRCVIPEQDAGWIREPGQHMIFLETAAFAAGSEDDPYELFRLRATKRSGEPGPTEMAPLEKGLQIWIEPL